MKAKKIVGEIGKFIHNLIYCIGCLAIWKYAFEHWPRGTDIAIGATLVCFTVWYFWEFFVRPFRAALRGESQ